MKKSVLPTQLFYTIFSLFFLVSCSKCKKDCDAVSANFTQALHPAFMLRPGEIDTVVLSSVTDDADIYEWFFGNNQMDGGNASTARIVIMNPTTSGNLTYENIVELNIQKNDNQCSLTQDVFFEGKLSELRVMSYYGTNQSGVTALYSVVFDGQKVKIDKPFPVKIPEAANVAFGGTLEIDEETGLLFGAPIDVVARCFPNSSNFALVTFPFDATITSMVLDVANQKVYYLANNFNQFSNVQVLDLKTDELSVLKNSTSPAQSTKLALSKNLLVWNTDAMDGTFSIYDISKQDVVQTATIGIMHPQSPIAVDKRSGEIYFSDKESNIFKFDPAKPANAPQKVISKASSKELGGLDIDEKAGEIIWSDPSSKLVWRAPLSNPANKTVLLDSNKDNIRVSGVTVGNFFK